MIGVSVLLLGRAHYVMHVRKQGNRASRTVTWLATVLVIGYWTWEWGFKVLDS